MTQSGDVIGLARGLLAAGAHHCVVTLWPVDDRLACLVMDDFAQRVRAGEPVAAALSNAQQRVRQTSRRDQDDWYTALAATADVPAVAQTRRSRRDLGAPGETRGLPPDHPSGWAPFVHIGI